MATVAVELSEVEVERLEERARRLGVAPAALLRAAARQLVEEPDDDLQAVANRVLSRNDELYKRLA